MPAALLVSVVGNGPAAPVLVVVVEEDPGIEGCSWLGLAVADGTLVVIKPVVVWTVCGCE